MPTVEGVKTRTLSSIVAGQPSLTEKDTLGLTSETSTQGSQPWLIFLPWPLQTIQTQGSG